MSWKGAKFQQFGDGSRMLYQKNKQYCIRFINRLKFWNVIFKGRKAKRAWDTQEK